MESYETFLVPILLYISAQLMAQISFLKLELKKVILCFEFVAERTHSRQFLSAFTQKLNPSLVEIEISNMSDLYSCFLKFLAYVKTKEKEFLSFRQVL